MTTESVKSRRRRRTYTAQFKADMVAQCLQGDVSLASLAVDHGMNPNVVHRWVLEHERYGGYGIVSLMAMATPDLDTLNEHQLRELARQLLADSEAQMARKNRLVHLKDTAIAQLKHEIAVLRRFQIRQEKRTAQRCIGQFARRSRGSRYCRHRGRV